jgi:hypothetical protein
VKINSVADTHLIPALRKLREGDHQFQTSLGFHSENRLKN